MAGHAPTKKDLEERRKRAAEFKKFMKENLFTEIRLAEVLGISRRSVQMIKSASVSPRKDTVRLFETLKKKYAKNRKAA